MLFRSPAGASFFAYSIAPVAVLIGLVAGMRARRRAPELGGEDVLAEREHLDARQSRWVLALAFIAVGLLSLASTVTFSISLSMTNVGVAASLSALDPLVIAPLGYVLLKERMTKLQMGGLGIALLGSILALSG